MEEEGAGTHPDSLSEVMHMSMAAMQKISVYGLFYFF